MAQALKDNKLQISDILRELKLLRSFVIGFAGKDEEGNYNPKFIEKILRELQEPKKEKTHTFKDKKTFLSQIS